MIENVRIEVIIRLFTKFPSKKFRCYYYGVSKH